jgi:protein TonB
MNVKSAILCAAAGLGAVGALCVLMPVMNRSLGDKPKREAGAPLRWMALARKPAEAPPAERPRPRKAQPKPSARPEAPKPAAGRPSPSAPRAVAPAPPSPLRVDPWDLGVGGPGAEALFVPPGLDAPAGGPAPEEKPAPEAPKELYLPAEVDELPRPLKQVLPEYPARALDRGIEGFVLLEFVVDREGKVAGARVADWGGTKEFCGPALQALARWTFAPGRKGGKPVGVRVTQRFFFREED